MEKAPDAFRTIGELSAELGVPQHVLRYWETKFPQLKPLQRAGNRRYYRAGEVALARRISHLLNVEGYTVRGVQKLLAEKSAVAPITPLQSPPAAARQENPPPSGAIDVQRLRALRDRLQDALAV